MKRKTIGKILRVVLFLCLVIGTGYGLMSWGCSMYNKATGRETKMEYGLCWVKVKGEWYCRSQVRSGGD